MLPSLKWLLLCPQPAFLQPLQPTTLLYCLPARIFVEIVYYISSGRLYFEIMTNPLILFISLLCSQEFQEEVEQHRGAYAEIKEVGQKITEACIPEEVSMVNQELDSIGTRWKDLNVTGKKRKRSIEDNYDMSSQFFAGADRLKESFAEVKGRIESDQTIGKDKAMVRAQIKKHKVIVLVFVLSIFEPVLLNLWMRGIKKVNCGDIFEISFTRTEPSIFAFLRL